MQTPANFFLKSYELVFLKLIFFPFNYRLRLVCISKWSRKHSEQAASTLNELHLLSLWFEKFTFRALPRVVYTAPCPCGKRGPFLDRQSRIDRAAIVSF